MDTYEKRRNWSDQFLPRVKEIVGPHLMEAAPQEYDVQRATDLVVMRAHSLDIAVRVRQHRYLERYGDQFTLRNQVWGDSESEVEKIRAGFGDLMFYGFCAESGPPKLSKWVILDLDAFRYQLTSTEGKRRLDTGTASNGDGTAFRWFKIDSLNNDVVVESYPAMTKSPPIFEPLDT